MRINRYEIKRGTKEKDLTDAGAIPVGGTDSLMIVRYIDVKHSDVRIEIIFPKEIKRWNDQYNVNVVDSDSERIYKKFYDFRNGNKEIVNEPALEIVVRAYNELMDSLPFMKRKK